MKRNDIVELHSKTVAELALQLEKVQKQLAESKLSLKVGKLENRAAARAMRDDIARIKTIMREKQIASAIEEHLTQIEATSTKEATQK